ncbi:MAG: hypothetical protein LBH42_00890 [Treponema sp.]|nr:hypothetical protein [Treponema sp.]
MDSGEFIYISSRLVLGAIASFLAIMLWSRTRDIAWILMVIGIIASYGETVYSIVSVFGLSNSIITVGSMPIVTIILPCLPMLFYIAAFAVMVARKYRH